MEELPTEINIITLNCWGLKYLSKLRHERLIEIGRQLASAQPVPHVVALQECWTQEDYQAIRRQTRLILPYGKFYFSGAFGGGLAILSRWPIEESTMFRYPLNGRPTAFFRGDWFVGKGVACAKIRFGPGPKHVIEVFNTHTHAPYEKEPNDSYVVHRTAQAWEMAKLIRGAAERGHLVLAAGDFNMKPLSLAHRLVTTHAPVRDVWRVLHPDSSVGAAEDRPEQARRRPIPTADFNVRENGVTSDSVYNTWRWTKKQQRLLGPGRPPCTVPPDSIDRRGKRLDYVFAGTGDVAALGGGWVVADARVGMTDRHPTLQCSLSDHFSVEATLVFHQMHQRRPRRGTVGGGRGAEDEEDAAVRDGTYLVSPTASTFRGSRTFDEQLAAAQSREDDFLPGSTYDEILAMIHKYVAREKKQRKWRGLHFFAWVGITIACYVGVWFSPRNFVAFILMVLCSLGLTAGTVDGLISLLFVNSELRALKEFEWEIINAKATASGSPPLAQDEDEKGW
ncbi:putative inositol phosphosphingolipids phospholipase c protein [Phaeoacremonium minimum UCRPA7]|uniref:Putative inositol phosphosphingolipids phospholipase c protein n=1 Tax=Phaeoacremonium minimum (strain UCR-PA7) TaxID=1286976 RepID=R8BT31_PHAM7|nr:putative inositol phosphosphingolipids phospholipase c protein [Phaeoacremonium minimum UCRPA7]EOO02464.1 putative inositol phosphosphingolipids phospholipase c protein [Phaeoacremonium minimum UCRPA7]